MKYLICNADDLGFGEERDRGASDGGMHIIFISLLYTYI